VKQETIQLVQTSWTKVAAIAPQAAALFYQHLFLVDPSLQPLFKGNMTQQGKMLMQMIGIAVGQLNELDRLVPLLQDLGRRHSGYGVYDAHYPIVGAALLKTLEQGLGDEFTPPVREAWAEVYGVMTDVMLAAARQES
jgi:hemoglobin-like flavoprotein